MIKHVVFISFMEEDTEQKLEQLKTLKNKIDNLKSQIPEVVSIESGLNISTSEKAFDFCLISDFKTSEDLENYRIHPAHKEVLAYMQQHNIKVAVVDYNY